MGLIVKDLFVAILFAILISGVCVFLLAWLPRSVYVRYSLPRLMPLAVLAVCAVACLYESFCFVGAMRVNRYVGGAARQIETLAARSGKLTEANLTQYIEEEYPVLSRYLPDDAGNVLVTGREYFNRLRRSIRGYAWRRAAWMIGFLVVGAGLLVRDATQQCKRDQALRNLYLDI